MEEPLFKPVSKEAKMQRMAWNTLEEVLKPIRNIKASYGLAERIRRINAHLRDVVGSPSYPHPITDAMIDQAIALAREGLVGSVAAQIADPRARRAP